MEVCQLLFTTSRQAEINDVIANSIGGAVAVVLILISFRIALLRQFLLSKPD